MPSLILRVLALLLVILPSVNASAQPVPETRVLRVVPHADLATIDPINTTAGITQSHAMLVYDFLFGRTARQEPRPQMVDTWNVTPDGLEWRFTLREGLRFHDGAPVTTADVIASLRRWGARDSYGRQIIALTTALEAVDAKTFVWRLSAPYSLMLEALSKSGSNVPAIMPARIAATDPFTSITDPTGSGPFVFSRPDWIPGNRVVYRRNEAYVPRSEPADGTAGGKVVKVDRVEFRILADAQSAAFALMNGEIDFLEQPSTEFLPDIRARGLPTVVTNELGSQGMLRMNHLHPPFNDARARRALLYLVDQEAHLTAMFGEPEFFRVCRAFFVCGAPFESAAGVEPDFGRNRERARALMREAGYRGEPIVVMLPADIAFLAASTQLLAQELRSIGVNVDLQSMDFATMARRRTSRNPPNEGGWHLGSTWWNGLGSSDPIGNLPMQASCERAWAGWPCDAGHQGLIDRFACATTNDERKRLADEIQASAYQLVPYVPLGQWFTPVAHSPRLRGLIGVPQVMVFWNVEKLAR